MMYFILAAFLILNCAASSHDGIASSLSSKIVGGEDVFIEEYPYQVSLTRLHKHICGAAIISDRYVLTAAQCVLGMSVTSLVVRVGTSERNYGGTLLNVEAVFQHPSYDPTTGDYDVAVLQLRGRIHLGMTQKPVALPDANEEVAPGTEAVVTGWGLLEEGGDFPIYLQRVRVPVVSQKDCRAAYGPSITVTDRMICAGLLGVGGKDTCKEDAGGPLVANGKLIGIVSWGYGCGRPDYPGVYTRVAAVRDFITYVSEI